MTFRFLLPGECGRIREIDTSQYIGRAWREVDGVRRLLEINDHDPDFPNGFDHHLAALTGVLASGGFAYGAFESARLVGFSSVDCRPFGARHRYALLDQLFISKEHRRMGIGRKLLMLSAKEAKQRGADKLYICAGSSEETVAFLRLPWLP